MEGGGGNHLESSGKEAFCVCRNDARENLIKESFARQSHALLQVIHEFSRARSCSAASVIRLMAGGRRLESSCVAIPAERK